MHRRLGGVTLACLFVLLALGITQAQKAPVEVPDFEVEGIAFTACQCTAYACPCRSNGHPTHGSCEAADFAHITRGHFGSVKLDGVKFVNVGNLLDKHVQNTYATTYFDEKTTPEQRDAVVRMLKFMFGPGWPVQTGQPKVVPISFTESPDKTAYTVVIPHILEVKGLLKRDKDGKPANPLPAMDQWGNKIHHVDNVRFKYEDKKVGKSWDLSNRQANVKFFHTTKKMYDNKELLAQHGDQSGTWTAKQRELIEKLGMKVQ